MKISDVVWFILTAALIALSVWMVVKLLRDRRRRQEERDEAAAPGTIEMEPGDFIDYGDYLVACACDDSSFNFDQGSGKKVITLASGASFTSDEGYKYVCTGCE